MTARLILTAGFMLSIYMLGGFLIITRTNHWALTAAWVALPAALVWVLLLKRKKK